MSDVIVFFAESIKQHTVSFTLFIFFLCCLFILWLSSKWRKKHNKRFVDREGDWESIPFFSLKDPTPMDKQAMSIIEEYRKNIWYKTASTNMMKSEELLHFIENLTSEIARIYYADASEPMYEASMVDILGLIGRVNEKLLLSTREFPLSLIADRRISEVLKMKDFYQTIRNHPVLEAAMKNRTLFRAGKALWSAYNTTNLWYWSRKIAYKATREAGLRYFYTLIVSQVGEEAVKVYSGRNIRSAEAGQDLLIAGEMINMALVGGEVTSAEYEEVLNFILGSRKLDSKDKIDLIRSLTNKKRIKSSKLSVLDSEKDRRLLIRQMERLASRNERFRKEKEAYLEKLRKRLPDQNYSGGADR